MNQQQEVSEELSNTFALSVEVYNALAKQLNWQSDWQTEQLWLQQNQSQATWIHLQLIALDIRYCVAGNGL